MKKTKISIVILSILTFASCKQHNQSKEITNTNGNKIDMEMNNSNQKELIKEIEHVHNDFNNALSKFSEEELNKIPFEGSWTAGQVAEHIIKSNEGILTQLLNGKSKSTNRPYDEQIGMIQEIFRGKEKMKSATALEPGQPPHSLDELLKTLQQQKEQQIETVKDKDIKVLVSELEFPPSPNGLTRYEWLILMMEHAERHRNQIDNIYKELQ